MNLWCVYIYILYIYIHIGVSKNSGTPKWMVYNGSKPYDKIDNLGGPPLFFGNTYIYIYFGNTYIYIYIWKHLYIYMCIFFWKHLYIYILIPTQLRIFTRTLHSSKPESTSSPPQVSCPWMLLATREHELLPREQPQREGNHLQKWLGHHN